ncbi:pyridoxal phosphate-dependent transferase [Polychytrium aggregatum]|uniref:pyridoxal phosphate-dependent transferase n=1 Tax=Polychytrium aggregatum TaxID=110093 RepID=UPI0022FDCB56|nr:pyridoxal phosphate-dependent transferase [Polychytrium aggregatum]KAI9205791.1 pyridoxal phosphate-dependent transferase [Polychytrium aggregatum]
MWPVSRNRITRASTTIERQPRASALVLRLPTVFRIHPAVDPAVDPSVRPANSPRTKKMDLHQITRISSFSNLYSDRTLFPSGDRGYIQFEFGAPSPALLQTASAIFQEATARKLSKPDAGLAFQYGPKLGDSEFRSELARFLANEYGSPVEANHLAVTSGASQSFSNLITMFTTSATRILIEDPTYFLALRVLQDHGFQERDFVSVPVESGGISLQILEERLKELSSSVDQQAFAGQPAKKFPFLLFTIPDYSNPTGQSMPLDKRIRLIELARKYDVLIICDDVYPLLGYPGAEPNPPRLIALEHQVRSETDFGNVISNCSFSKIFAPGARLGWVEASPAIIKRHETFWVLYSGGSPNHLTSGIMTEIIQTGKLKTYIAQLRETYSHNAEVTYETLRLHGEGLGMRIEKPKGGFFIWIEFPSHVNTHALYQQLKQKEAAGTSNTRVSFAPGLIFTTVQGRYLNCLRLSIAHYDAEELREGARRLCRAVKELLDI